MNAKRFRLTLLAIFAMFILPTARGQAHEKILRRFNDKHGWNGMYPSSPLVFDSAGNLYGTVAQGGGGGRSCGGYACGAVFELSPDANGIWIEKVLSTFAGKNGQDPAASLIFDAGGNLYGTTNFGGGKGCNYPGCGTVFELAPGAGGKWTRTLLHAFDGEDGDQTYAPLIFDSAGNLYGTTLGGGAYGGGTVFELTPGGNGQWTESLLYSFNSQGGGDGFNPYAGVIFDSSGNLYGTTLNGGAYIHGTVFELTPGANGKWTETVLHSFEYNNRDGFYPYGGLVFDAAGNLYGTGYDGGTYGYGAIFEMTAGKNGQWTETLLYSFGSSHDDGWLPMGNLIFDSAGSLYGTTEAGGVQNRSKCSTYGCGTVFKLSPGVDGKWTEEVLQRFGRRNDGYNTQVGVVLGTDGNLYGTTPYGGTWGFGTVYEITP